MNLWRWLTTPDPHPGFTRPKLLKLALRLLLFVVVATLLSSLLSWMGWLINRSFSALLGELLDGLLGRLQGTLVGLPDRLLAQEIARMSTCLLDLLILRHACGLLWQTRLMCLLTLFITQVLCLHSTR